MAYLNSENIGSYPSTKRASVNKLITENTVTRVINRLIDKDSYVITNGLNDINFSADIPIGKWAEWGADFEFVIHGYYFCVTPGEGYGDGLSYLLSQVNLSLNDDTRGTEHTLYARIFIDKIDQDFPELYGQEDVDDKYQAIQFYWDNLTLIYPDGGQESQDYDVYNVPLVKYMADDTGTSFDYYIPLTSLFRFGSQAIENIDGGEIFL